jgi:hypothetical protein
MKLNLLRSSHAVPLVVCWLAARSAVSAEVRLLDLHPEGVGRTSRLGGRELNEALAGTENGRWSGRSAKGIEIVAWSTKACTTHLPPAISEEAIVLVHWESPDVWSLFCFGRSHHGFAHFHKGWQPPGELEIIGLLWNAESEARPSEDQVMDFIRQTNFGNNEFESDVAVLGVFLYAGDLQKLREELTRGLPQKERERRRKRFFDKIVE